VTPTQERTLRRMQNSTTRLGDCVFSRRTYHVPEATMRALLYAKFIAWVDDVATDDGILPYYRLTEAGKKWNAQEVGTE
jgi:hypothetical protein